MYSEPGRFGDYEELPGNLQTEMLTVWRTLWVELDQMYVPSGPDKPDGAPADYQPSSTVAAGDLLAEDFPGYSCTGR